LTGLSIPLAADDMLLSVALGDKVCNTGLHGQHNWSLSKSRHASIKIDLDVSGKDNRHQPVPAYFDAVIPKSNETLVKHQ
jgi:hypothetical protein